jgi:hypothetical protein
MPPGFSQHDDSVFGVLFNDGSNDPPVNQALSLSGSFIAT